MKAWPVAGSKVMRGGRKVTGRAVRVTPTIGELDTNVVLIALAATRMGKEGLVPHKSKAVATF